MIRSREKELFQEWSRNRPNLVRDGVVNVDAYRNSRNRLLFVLKEVNDPGGGGWDLRAFVRHGAQGATWNNITRWTEGIRKLPRDLTWSTFRSVNEQKRREVLQSIAALNVKKEPGGGSSDKEEVKRYAEEDENFLKRQFDIYEPEIVICCGVDYKCVPQLRRAEWKTTSHGIDYSIITARQIAIDYWHPQARFPNHLLFFSLMEAVTTVKQISGNPFRLP